MACRVRQWLWSCLALPLSGVALAQPSVSAPSSSALQRGEAAYADFNDAYGALSLIDSNPGAYPDGYAGRTREAWRAVYVARRAELARNLEQASSGKLSGSDARAVEVMQAALAESSEEPHSLAPAGHCNDAQRADLPLQGLQDALYACFAELGNSLQFENARVTRVAAFEMLTSMPQEERRKALFLAFQPLWLALNGHDEADSPYRRLIRMAAAQAKSQQSPIDAAARTVGVSTAECERWLERILDTWRQVSGETAVEPWDYRFAGGAADRTLAAAIPREALQPLNERYYRDLGLDLAAAGVIYDLEPRNGKAPLAYTDYVQRGRMVAGGWQPTIVRVSASYARGGLGPLNELVHENGHVAHMLALRTRPAFMDLGDAIYYEAFADVPSWSVYEPLWQKKYLGRSIAQSASLRALYSGVMLDVAWALFDLRMLREPQADPNALWTEITHHYLHVTPHPELTWWAVRVQLVHKPGYMVNYGLGAVITADIRQRIAQQLGPSHPGDARWYGWLSEHLLRSGEEQPTSQLLREFLGRPVSPQALVTQLQRIAVRVDVPPSAVRQESVP
ncbi:MAG TPA: hypothetical protein VKB72_09235 [Steroidobacteraceae bacterium]|nr:hypothetical protein [Steroidobacteraceae bacterium]